MKVCYEAFSCPEIAQLVEWEKEDLNLERVCAQVSYCHLLESGPENFKRIVELLHENPSELIRCMGIALDALRFYSFGLQDRKYVVVRARAE